MRRLNRIVLICSSVLLVPGLVDCAENTWKVPANSVGNRLVVTVENTGTVTAEEVFLRVLDFPAYVLFEPSEFTVKSIAPGESKEVVLIFSVDRRAPIKQVDTIILQLQSSTDTWQKELSFTYLEPTTYKLEQNFPNPFNPSTTMQYQLPMEGWVTLTIYDVLGRQVATPVDEKQQPGYYDVLWNAASVASGMYFYGLTASTDDGSAYTSIKKMLLVK